jgi:hypothetical protein
MDKNHRNKINFEIFFCFFLPACLSSGGFKTARPLKSGKHYLVAAIGKGGLKYSNQSNINNNSQKAIEDSGLPIVTTGVRYGASDQVELGLQLAVPGTLDFDSKFNFYNSKKSAYSFYTGIGGLYARTDKDSLSEIILINNYYSVAADYDINKYLTLQLAPILSWRKINLYLDNEKSSSIQYFAGISSGFYIKNFFFQIRLSTSLSKNNHYFKQITLGYWGGWDDLNKNL